MRTGFERLVAPAVVLFVLVGLTAAHADGPATAPSGPHLNWPTGWKEHAPSAAVIRQAASNAGLAAGADFQVFKDRPDDAGKSVADYAAERVDGIKATEPMRKINAQFGKLRQETVGGHEATVVEIDATVSTGTKVHYEYVYFKQDGSFCKMMVVSTAARWEQAKTCVDGLVAAVQ